MDFETANYQALDAADKRQKARQAPSQTRLTMYRKNNGSIAYQGYFDDEAAAREKAAGMIAIYGDNIETYTLD